LTPAASMTWLKQQIADCVEQKNRLSEEMERWYSEGNSKRFPQYTLLEQTHKRLSHLDSSYKPLWDRYGEASSINMN
jgi:hypothetical protein